MEELTLRSSDMDQRILPIELWEIIFELATACAEEWEFGHRNRLPIFGSVHFNSNLFNPCINSWEDVLKTRRSLVAVSRFFNQLTTPLLYQSFFAITLEQEACFERTLQIRPALGQYVKRLGLSTQLEPLEPRGNTHSPRILGFCPNTIFCDTKFNPTGLTLVAPSLRSLEIFFSPLVMDGFPDLLAGILQATPQLEHLGVYGLPFRVEQTYSRSLASIRLESLRAFHLRAGIGGLFALQGRILTAQIFFSLTLPRLEDLLIQGTNLNGIPASWLRDVRQIKLNHESIRSCNLESNHFRMLRKFTLYFTNAISFPRGELHEKLPFIRIEEIELYHCVIPICFDRRGSTDTLSLILRLCADDTATPMLNSLSMDVAGVMDMVENKGMSPRIAKEHLSQLQSTMELILVRGLDLKGCSSSLLHSILQELINFEEERVGKGFEVESSDDWR